MSSLNSNDQGVFIGFVSIICKGQFGYNLKKENLKTRFKFSPRTKKILMNKEMQSIVDKDLMRIKLDTVLNHRGMRVWKGLIKRGPQRNGLYISLLVVEHFSDIFIEIVKGPCDNDDLLYTLEKHSVVHCTSRPSEGRDSHLNMSDTLTECTMCRCVVSRWIFYVYIVALWALES